MQQKKKEKCQKQVLTKKLDGRVVHRTHWRLCNNISVFF